MFFLTQQQHLVEAEETLWEEDGMLARVTMAAGCWTLSGHFFQGWGQCYRTEGGHLESTQSLETQLAL